MRARPPSSFPARLAPLVLLAALAAQDPRGGGEAGAPPFGPGGRGPGGPGGPGMQQEQKVRERFDANRDGQLDKQERTAARAWLKENRPQRGMRGPGGAGGPGGPPRPADDGPPKTGGRVSPADVPIHTGRPLFDPDIVRTFFVDFGDPDWHAELTDFHRTDVVVPATVTVDGEVLRDVGVQFRGNTSFGMAPGKKKSLDLTFDAVHARQTLLGVRNLDLLNNNADPSLVREMLHGTIASRFAPAPRTALARVVVDGEDYGVYVAVQQFDKEFVADHFGTKGGDRFKVPPDFAGGGGLRFLGEDPAAYRRNYQLKSGESESAWNGLVALCNVLANAPDERLEAILPQHLDIEGTLWFLALDFVLGDDDGYFSRASDYLLYRDPKGRFHPVPRDNNEMLLGPRGGGPRPGGAPPAGAGPVAGGDGPRPPRAPQGGPVDAAGGPAGGGPPGGARRGPGGPGGGTATTPLQGASRADRPLLHRLLAVPAWRERYLANVRTIATTALRDDVLAPRLASWRELLQPLVDVDAHSLYGAGAFAQAFAVGDDGKPAPRSLRAIVAQRCKTILDDAAMQGAWPELGEPRASANAGPEGTHALTVTCAVRGGEVGAVTLFADKGSFGAFTPYRMHDDGAHGDGAAGDGVFGATLPAVETGATWRYWVEAAAAGSGHVGCQPPGNGARAATWKAPAAAKARGK
jgi:hypothetical protein